MGARLLRANILQPNNGNHLGLVLDSLVDSYSVHDYREPPERRAR